MTTNSFGTSPLPKFDYEPVFAKTARGSGLPMGARVLAVAAATGVAYYATSKSNSNPQQPLHQSPSPSSPYGLTNDALKERQFLTSRLSETMWKRQQH